MTCSTPPQLTDLEIEMFIAGEATPAVAAHHAHCAACAARVAHRAGEEAALHRRLFRADCPPALALGEWQMQLLASEEATRLAEHLARCPWCQEEVGVIAEMLTLPLSVPEPRLAGIRRLVATLISQAPGASGQPALALRGSESDQLSFAADTLTITLATESTAQGQLMLSGLVIDADGALGALAGQSVHLLQFEQIVAETVVDDLNNFAFAAIPPGSYALAVPRDETVILIPEVELALA